MAVRRSIRKTLVQGFGLATALVSVMVAAPAAHAGAIYPAPDRDGFYYAAGNLGGAANGDVLNSRPMPSPWPGASVTQILFRSTNSVGAPIPAVTTLISPGPGPRPLLSYQPFVNSLGMQCAPSHSIFDGSMKESAAFPLLLARGWAIAVPDHLGPDSAYGAARMGGQITLDGIRAVKRFAPAGLGDSPVGLAGYSGGAMSTGFAAALAPDYAPELPIVGVAEGGVPVNPGKMAIEAGDSPQALFGLGFAVAIGMEREYPAEINLDQSLTPFGFGMRERIANSCVDDIISVGANHSISDVFHPGMENDPTMIRTMHENALEMVPELIRAPLYEWHGGSDQVPLNLAMATAGRYCAAGTPVQFDIIPGADHLGAILPGSANAMNYLADRFAGRPAPSNCH
ncbi:lipase family protein [Nocardia sp. NBC_00511]|uniref:lipase family protein n=1 Tax=Nocardia sp. NBC_00511 TaxID=2903591 RepID=UPI0030E40EC4